MSSGTAGWLGRTKIGRWRGSEPSSSDLIDPAIAIHHGRVVKRTGDGILIEFRSVVDAVRCAIEVQNGMFERNAGVAPERRIELRIGIHLGDVVEAESDGDLMGDGVNVAARLESVAEPNGVCLSAAAYEQVRDKVSDNFVDLGAKELKNIARPVRAYGLSPRQDVRKLEPILSAAGPGGSLALPHKPSIAVLAFQNMSGDPDQEYFADGLAENIITRLSRLRWLFVSARNSSFTYKGKSVDAKKVGRELGVRYVIDGSVRRSGHRLRVSSQVIDLSMGLQVWAKQYDVELADFFAVQDQIAESVIAAIEPRLYEAEYQHFQSSPPDSLDAWGFVAKAMPYVWNWISAHEIEVAQALLTRATDLDPDYPRANSLLAWTHAARFQSGLADADVLPAAHAMAQRAIRRDPEDPWCHMAAGYVHMVSRGFAPAVRELSEAIKLNPSFAFAHVVLGLTYGYGGMGDDGLHHLAIAARLSPRDFTYAANFSATGLCYFMKRRFADAVECERRAVESIPTLERLGVPWRRLPGWPVNRIPQSTLYRRQSVCSRLYPSTLSIGFIRSSTRRTGVCILKGCDLGLK